MTGNWGNWKSDKLVDTQFKGVNWFPKNEKWGYVISNKGCQEVYFNNFLKRTEESLRI